MAVIEIGQDYSKRPQVTCPGCKKNIIMDLRPFQQDASQITKDKCPYCGQLLFTALLICAHPTLQGLKHMIAKYLEVLDPGNKHLYGNKTH